MTHLPFVSVIVPTHNRCDILPRTLTAITQQSYPADRFELIVVADGCQDGTADLVKQFVAPCALHLVERAGVGPAEARNSGAQRAMGELFLFIDDDVEVVPHFIAAHVANHASENPTIVLGALPIVGEPNGRFFDQGLRQWWQEKFTQLRTPGHRFQYGDLYTGNVSINGALFRALGGFDTHLWCHEDYEFGIRAAEAGAIFCFSDEALGYHHDETTMHRSFKRRMAEGKADVYLARRYPDLRDQLSLGVMPFSLLSRLFRFTAFRLSWFGLLIVQLGLMLLVLFEWGRLKRPWQAVFAHLQDFYYWLGVAQNVADPSEVAQFYQEMGEASGQNGRFLTIDLSEGVTKIEAQMAAIRPDGVTLLLGKQWLGDVAPVFGAEQLRLAHIESLLQQPERSLPHLTMARLFGSAALLPMGAAGRAATFETPRQVAEVDLLDEVVDIEVLPGHALYLLVKMGAKPVGWLSFGQHEKQWVTAELIRAEVKKRLAGELVAEVWKRPFVPPAPPPTTSHAVPITVIVCTRDRCEQLQRCLEALFLQVYPHYKIIVVDNAPSNSETADLIGQINQLSTAPITYVREDRPGLDWARNRGILEAKTELIAFTDDDARPDKHWLTAVVTQFESPEIMAVTGPALPAKLDTPYQNLFEFGYGGMSHGFGRRFMRRSGLSEMGLLWASGFGVGANMAFRTAVFDKIGLFDEALDVGTPSNGGGDIEMFHRLVAHGETLLYEPSAFVWHEHRPSRDDLLKQMANNGRGFGVYLLSCGRNRTVSWPTIVYFWVRHWLWAWIVKRLIWPNGFPRLYIWQELKGGVQAIYAYFLAQAHKQRVAAQDHMAPETAVADSAPKRHHYQTEN